VASSLVGLPLLGLAKHRLADMLGSVATRGEGTQSLLCAISQALSCSVCPATPCSAGGGCSANSGSIRLPPW
jgi:hypothetical protein